MPGFNPRSPLDRLMIACSRLLACAVADCVTVPLVLAMARPLLSIAGIVFAAAGAAAFLRYRNRDW
jgi:hypothetical protein